MSITVCYGHRVTSRSRSETHEIKPRVVPCVDSSLDMKPNDALSETLTLQTVHYKWQDAMKSNMLWQPSVRGTSVNVDLITWVIVQTAIMIRFRRGCHALLKLNTWNSIHLQPAGKHSDWHQRVTLSITINSTTSCQHTQAVWKRKHSQHKVFLEKIWLLVRWHQNPKQSIYLEHNMLTAHWELRQDYLDKLYERIIYSLSEEKSLSVRSTVSLSSPTEALVSEVRCPTELRACTAWVMN